MTACPDTAAPAEAHQALFYRDSDEYLDGISGFIEPALQAGAPVAIAVPEPNMARVRGLLGDRVCEIQLFDMRKLGRNPGRIISAVQGMIEWHEGQLLHYVGEPIWPGRSPAEIREATRHEALINLAWPDGDVRVLCPYDAGELDDAVLLDAERTHPGIRRSGRVEASDAYESAGIPSSCEVPLSDPPPEALALAFEAEDLETLRRLVADRAAAAGLGSYRAATVVLALHELVTNSIRHTGCGGTLRVWTEPGELVCQVEDRGHILDWLAGRRRRAAGGEGLWIVNHVSDLVEVRTGVAGTTVRVHTRAAAA